MTTTDPRIPATFPYYALAQQVAALVQSNGPINNPDLREYLRPSKVTSPFLTYILKALRDAGVIRHEGRGVWASLGTGERVQGRVQGRPAVKKLCLVDAALYRVKTKDGRVFKTMMFNREELAWRDAYTSLGVDDIASVAFISASGAFKTGTELQARLDRTERGMDDCTLGHRLPKPDKDSAVWVNPMLDVLPDGSHRRALNPRIYRPPRGSW